MVTQDKYETPIKPTFCPGCGNFGIMQALKQALEKLNINPHQAVISYDIGCNSNMADFVDTYGFHGLHGRSLPATVGIKLGNHKLVVLSLTGDGGFYGEGGVHFLSLMRGNHDVTVLVCDNHRYSLTTGQFSPTTPKGTKTISTPEGSIEEPINPLSVALVNHATFVARGFAGDIPQLTDLIIKGIQHTGFSLLEILQPCVIWNKHDSYAWYQEKVYQLAADYSPHDTATALQKARETDKLATGVFFQKKSAAYHQQVASLQKDKALVDMDISQIDISQLLEEFC